MSNHLHYLTVQPADETHPEPRQTFECRGDQTAKCHQYPDCECEAWSENHEHPYVAHTECWMQGWFDNDASIYSGDDADCFNDSGIPAGTNRNGPVKTWFELEYVAWEWAVPA